MVRKQEVMVSKESHITDSGNSKCKDPNISTCFVGYRMVERMTSVAKWHEQGEECQVVTSKK